MDRFKVHSRDSLLHLATCAAQVAEAVAVSVETHGEGAFNPHAGLRTITDAHMCHLEAAVLMMGLLMRAGGGDVAEWRDSIPELVASIAGAVAE